MKKTVGLDSLEAVSPVYLAEAENYRAKPRRLRLAALAACLAVVVLGAGAAVTVEAKEYAAAAAFFAENGLSSAGLSRAEIKAVYRDITTEHFTYEKTADVLRQIVGGYEIEMPAVTPEELAALWERATSGASDGYRIRYDYRLNPALGFETHYASLIERYEDGSRLWTAEVRDFEIWKYTPLRDGVAVWGMNPTWSSAQTCIAYLAVVDGNGTILFEKSYRHGDGEELIDAVVENSDGTVTVISHASGKLCAAKLTPAGEELFYTANPIGSFGVGLAAPFGDGYIVQIGNVYGGARDTESVVKLDANGVLTDTFTYESDGVMYRITDMAEYDGQIVLSTYAVPEQTDEGGRDEIGNLWDFSFAMLYEQWEESGERGLMKKSDALTEQMKKNYSAVLLLCDGASGETKTFYSVPGALGGALTVEGGRLIWSVNRIVSSLFSPMTNAFTFVGDCQVMRYTFTGDTLVDAADTGETYRFYR